MVTVDVPPAHLITVVTAAFAVMSFAPTTSIVPVTGAQAEASATLHTSPAPAATLVNIPVALVIPLSVRSKDRRVGKEGMVTVAVPQAKIIGVVNDAFDVMAFVPRT